MTLETIEAALDEGDARRALAAAVATWVDTRDARLGDVVAALAAPLATPPFARGLSDDELHEAWMKRAVAEDPAEMDALLGAVGRGETRPRIDWRSGTQRRHAPMEARLARLAQMPPDPRTARALAQLVRQAPWSSSAYGTSALYARVFHLLTQVGDRQTVATLEDVLARPSSRVQGVRALFATELPEVIEQITARAVTPVSESGLARIRERLGLRDEPEPTTSASTNASGAELLQRVYDDPNDDAAREVYADWLLERDDPRGEFIVLQFKDARGEATPAEIKRMNALLRAHQDEWLGELATMLSHRVFRRGFLDEAAIQAHAAADDAAWERAIADPRLATVRHLAKGRGNETTFRKFTLAPARRASLIETSVPSKAMLDWILASEQPFGIEQLHLERGTKQALVALVHTSCLPELETLGVTVDFARAAKVLAPLRGSALLSRLRTLRVQPAASYGDLGLAHLGDVLHLVETLEPLPAIVASVAMLDVVARRGERGLEISVTAGTSWRLAEVLSALPADVASLSVEWKTTITEYDLQVLQQQREVVLAAILRAGPRVSLDPQVAAAIGAVSENSAAHAERNAQPE